MMSLVLFSSILVGVVTVLQYNEQSRDYHRDRLKRKEAQVLQRIRYELQETTYALRTENLEGIFAEEIYRIAVVLNVDFDIYDLQGELILSSRRGINRDSVVNCLDLSILDGLEKDPEHRYVVKRSVGQDSYLSSFVYLNDLKFKPIGIINIPYYADNSFSNRELREFLWRLLGVYVVLIAAAMFIAFVLTRYITSSLKTISNRISSTELHRRNQKIFISGASTEVSTLVKSYNAMIDQLEESATKLARSEREYAWREMAKQVAHEIKNPLTPMRLNVQSMQRIMEKDPESARVRFHEFSESLIQQIDTLTEIAQAFSHFAKLPTLKFEPLNAVEVIRRTLEVFAEKGIQFRTANEHIEVLWDRTQLVRMVNNLVKNALQAIPQGVEPDIQVSISDLGEHALIRVRDNGSGISEENLEKIFEPRFTTKSSGMGLGLAMVKSMIEHQGGELKVSSTPGKGTTFSVYLRKKSIEIQDDEYKEGR